VSEAGEPRAIDAGERDAMARAVRAALADADAGADAVDETLEKLGWRAMLDEAPDDAVAVVFRELGAANAPSAALDDVLASALGVEPRADLAVVLPPFAAWDAPGRLDAGGVRAHGLAKARIACAAEVLVVCGTTSGPQVAIVPASVVVSEEIRGIDPAAGFRSVRVQGRTARMTPVDPAAWTSAVALGRRALAYEMAGACRAMLDLARAHALVRTQFGRPVARFQAVRHRLAETLVAIEALEAALAAAHDEPCAATAELAKAVAGRASGAVVKHCQQVLAGVGFTTEHPFHRHAKRVLLLEGVLGSADRIVLDVGRRLLAERRVPTLIEL
jgi:hypothetical protein